MKYFMVVVMFLLMAGTAFADDHVTEWKKLRTSRNTDWSMYQNVCIDGLRFIQSGSGSLIQVFIPVKNEVTTISGGARWPNTIITSVPAACKE